MNRLAVFCIIGVALGVLANFMPRGRGTACSNGWPIIVAEFSLGRKITTLPSTHWSRSITDPYVMYAYNITWGNIASIDLHHALDNIAIFVGAMLPLYGVHAMWKHRHQPAEGCCQKCGYNLTGNVSGVCPECGMPIGADAMTPAPGKEESPS